MTTPGIPGAAPADLWRAAASVQSMAHALLRKARLIDALLAARKRRREDLQALAAMSDYELRDLGLHRLDVPQVAAGLHTVREDFR
jgi:uncharacterized protein YjiS (DUF1127 family)